MTAQREMFVCGLLINVSSLFKTRQALKLRVKRTEELQNQSVPNKGGKWKMVPKGVHEIKQ